MPDKKIILVSACLAGLQTRYDNQLVSSAPCLAKLSDLIWIPVCPEQLGGLATPRCAADLVGGDGDDVLNGSARVLTKNGQDVTQPFIKGAQQVLQIAQRQSITKAFLKARSPSCGVSKNGVTAALLARTGIELEEFD